MGAVPEAHASDQSSSSSSSSSESEGPIAKRPPPFTKLQRNKILHRPRNKQHLDSVPQCCCIPSTAAVAEGPSVPELDARQKTGIGNGAADGDEGRAKQHEGLTTHNHSARHRAGGADGKRSGPINCGDGCLNAAVRVECTPATCPCGDLCR
eukprot:CAMPEP_0206145252 /NCGR_PEP_ID=MMETSP1473-20131121/26807_1 /ASSEMBLY_ACC=CAM_ASM_001109 /TAXON_ID=1461547 /ORGANISM="Stichococcus sp, Strain RCC1054" /LENGTH=151 /DNA_ID=CAMNT_0053541391 /DNA_START=131 /DNA_END=582 /DNA_ORIENTATION=-